LISSDHDVGYGRPPKGTQFRPGRSGNPAGRRKSVRNLRTDVQRTLKVPLKGNASGRPRPDRPEYPNLHRRTSSVTPFCRWNSSVSLSSPVYGRRHISQKGGASKRLAAIGQNGDAAAQPLPTLDAVVNECRTDLNQPS